MDFKDKFYTVSKQTELIFLIRVCTVLCGGNIDASTLTRVVDRGLIAEGRICRFTVIVSDRPGGMAEMLNVIAEVKNLNSIFLSS